MTNTVTLKEVYTQIVERRKIVEDVNREINRQDEIWGKQNHSFAEWIVILGEEFGEACEEVNEIKTAKSINAMAEAIQRLDEELIQVIAVCFRILEKTRDTNANS